MTDTKSVSGNGSKERSRAWNPGLAVFMLALGHTGLDATVYGKIVSFK